mmetsp:Transcript_111897/g.182399  ORF Transcript_111897/g.182399 Transcript_111897/m.182399 type:complete len:88 (-) Transcript_111897:132-395(-)
MIWPHTKSFPVLGYSFIEIVLQPQRNPKITQSLNVIGIHTQELRKQRRGFLKQDGSIFRLAIGEDQKSSSFFKCVAPTEGDEDTIIM